MLQISTTVDALGQQITVSNADLTYSLPVSGIGHIEVLGKINGALIQRDLTTQEMTDFIAGTDLVLDIATETSNNNLYMPDDFYVIQLTVLVSGSIADASNQTTSLQYQDIEKAVGDKVVSATLYPSAQIVKELHEYNVMMTGLNFLGSNPALTREGEAVTRLSLLTLKLSGAA